MPDGLPGANGWVLAIVVGSMKAAFQSEDSLASSSRAPFASFVETVWRWEKEHKLWIQILGSDPGSFTTELCVLGYLTQAL